MEQIIPELAFERLAFESYSPCQFWQMSDQKKQCDKGEGTVRIIFTKEGKPWIVCDKCFVEILASFFGKEAFENSQE